MWAILTFFILVLVLYLGFGWLADNPGSVTFVWQGQSVEVSLVVFLVATLVFIGAVLVIAWAIAKFFQAPGAWGTSSMRYAVSAKPTSASTSATP